VNVKEKLTAFLYLMMRDEVSVGVVCKKIMDLDSERDVHDGGDVTKYEFTNPHLAALADDYAGRLLDGCWD